MITHDEHEAATDHAFAIARQLDESRGAGNVDWKSLLQKILQLLLTLGPVIIPLLSEKQPADPPAPPADAPAK